MASLEGNARLLETVNILERRLRLNAVVEEEGPQEQEEEVEDDELFSPLHRVLYTHMLGEAYMRLYIEYGSAFYYNDAVILSEFVNRAESALRSALNLAVMIGLEPTSELRLLATCSLCRCLAVLRSRHRRARRLLPHPAPD